MLLRILSVAMTFLSTPSARRATRRPCRSCRRCGISIHALREEGDLQVHHLFDLGKAISIHALREEGDRTFRLLAVI